MSQRLSDGLVSVGGGLLALAILCYLFVVVPFYISPKATEYRKHNKQWPSERPDSIEELVAKADPYILLVAKSAGITVIVGLVLVMTGRAIAPIPFESGRRPSPRPPSKSGESVASSTGAMSEPDALSLVIPGRRTRAMLPSFWSISRHVRSHDIALGLGLTPSTVRQDFTYLNVRGLSKKGYDVARLTRVISLSLGMHKDKRAVVVGAGNMGSAVARHRSLRNYGFTVTAIVDQDPWIIGKKIGRLTVKHRDQLPDIVKKHDIDIGIIHRSTDSPSRTHRTRWVHFLRPAGNPSPGPRCGAKRPIHS